MAAIIQPRTGAIYYLILPAPVMSCLALTMGLTYAPCHSSMCVEGYFPCQVRGHIGLFYGLLVGVGLALWVRLRFQSAREFFGWQPMALDKVMFITGKRVSMGAVLIAVWIIGSSFGATGYWYPAERAYWMKRGEVAGWTTYIFRIVWTGVTGHWIDIWLGLVLIPIGRNSMLGRVFELHSSTLLFAHKLLAYSLAVGAVIHGLIYYSFLAAWVSRANVWSIMQQFNPDNPGLTWHQAELRGVYSWFVLPTGAASGLVLIPAIVITSLPLVRRMNYNTFYFVHIIFAALIMVPVCIHASTNFYCLLPGLLFWVGDWAWRFCNALGISTIIQVEGADNGWYRIRLPPNNHAIGGEREEGLSAPLPSQPLISYYLNVPKISKIQSHPFTVAIHAEGGPLILFQRGPERKKAKKTDKEWTWKLAAMVDNWAVEKPLTLEARIEGPYVEHTPQFHAADHVLAIAGGTGITGALSLANLWLADQANHPMKSLRLIWTVRDQTTAQLQEVSQLRVTMEHLPNADLVVHVSSGSGRIDPDAILRGFTLAQEGRSGKVWVYASGPAGLLKDVEAACTEQRREMRASGAKSAFTTLDRHIASFEV